jgi:predicted DNA-binding antitoxin AbrB/MazE fold protein
MPVTELTEPIAISAVVQGGMLRPLEPTKLPFAEGQQVEIVIQPSTELHPILKLAAEVYDGLSEDEIAEIESIALERRDFFQYP